MCQKWPSLSRILPPHWLSPQLIHLASPAQNSYFPLFITEDVLNTEKDHVEGFAPEVAWVTKTGSSDMEKPIAIRPTSETVRACALFGEDGIRVCLSLLITKIVTK
eukprot:scaffold133723_cov17-Tisochrysis_lutea.AAC.1